jgi:small subunit ribosomal protein S15
MYLIRKGVQIKKHIELNHKDGPAIRGLILTESKIGRLVKYYKEIGKIEPGWKYNPDQARFYLE